MFPGWVFAVKRMFRGCLCALLIVAQVAIQLAACLHVHAAHHAGDHLRPHLHADQIVRFLRGDRHPAGHQHASEAAHADRHAPAGGLSRALGCNDHDRDCDCFFLPDLTVSPRPLGLQLGMGASDEAAALLPLAMATAGVSGATCRGQSPPDLSVWDCALFLRLRNLRL